MFLTHIKLKPFKLGLCIPTIVSHNFKSVLVVWSTLWEPKQTIFLKMRSCSDTYLSMICQPVSKSESELFSLREFPRHASLDAKVKGHHNIVDFDEMLIRAITRAITKLGQIFWFLSKSCQPRVSFFPNPGWTSDFEVRHWKKYPKNPKNLIPSPLVPLISIFGHFCR